MSYCFSTCDVPVNPPFASCLFAGPVDLSDFDANFGRDGILEVVFEVVSPTLGGKLQLNYGNHPRRKYVQLVQRGEVLQAGIYREYFTPDQVRFSSAAPFCQETCGVCDQVQSDPLFRFDAVDMTLVAEGCAAGVDGRVRLLSVNVVSRGCGCVSDTGCSSAAGRPVCYPPDSGAGACGWPGNALPGVCGARARCDTDVPIGSACIVDVGVETCSGTWQCDGGQLSCEVQSCP